MIPVDLNSPIERKRIAQLILQDIDEYCSTTYDDGHRNHLGVSQIGHVCSRNLFNVFRWIYHKKQPGRMQRLFNRGHREEARFVEWLTGVGFEVKQYEDTGKQMRISDCKGHYGGSLDGQLLPPERYNLPKDLLLCEFKTNGTGPAFAKLKQDGVAKAKPQHYAQMSSYGKYRGFNFAVYLCINKNDDDIHIEIVPLDWQLAEQLTLKANDIIFAEVPPAKFAFSEAVLECKFCDFVGQCHRGEPVEKNCRSCINSRPVDNAQWKCLLYNNIIPPDFIPKGCDSWKAIV